jgi:hypothetical protein
MKDLSWREKFSNPKFFFFLIFAKETYFILITDSIYKEKKK